jgi:hypothetical protein
MSEGVSPVKAPEHLSAFALVECAAQAIADKSIKKLNSISKVSAKSS